MPELDNPQLCDESIQDMAATVREQNHERRLQGARIKYVFMPKLPKHNGKIRLGTTKKLSSADSLLMKADFIIKLNHEEWQVLTDDQRRALLDHELSHCGKNEDFEWSLIPHDMEEFAGIVQRHGLWQKDVVNFMNRVQQTMLFDEDIEINGQGVTA